MASGSLILKSQSGFSSSSSYPSWSNQKSSTQRQRFSPSSPPSPPLTLLPVPPAPHGAPPVPPVPPAPPVLPARADSAAAAPPAPSVAPGSRTGPRPRWPRSPWSAAPRPRSAASRAVWDAYGAWLRPGAPGWRPCGPRNVGGGWVFHGKSDAQGFKMCMFPWCLYMRIMVWVYIYYTYNYN